MLRRKELCNFTTQVIHGKWFAKDGVYGLVEVNQLFKISTHHQNRQRGGDMFDTTSDFATVYSRHEKINYHQIERLLGDKSQPFDPVLRLGNGVPIDIQQ